MISQNIEHHLEAISVHTRDTRDQTFRMEKQLAALETLAELEAPLYAIRDLLRSIDESLTRLVNRAGWPST